MIAGLLGRFSPWIAGAAVTVILALGGLWKLETARREAAQARIAVLDRELAAAREAIAGRDTLIGALERQAAAVAAIAARLEPVRRAVNAQPSTSACLASPAVRVGLERLRASRPAAAPQPRPQPPDLPAGTAGARA